MLPSQVSETVPTVVEGSSIVNSSVVGDDVHPLTETPNLYTPAAKFSIEGPDPINTLLELYH